MWACRVFWEEGAKGGLGGSWARVYDLRMCVVREARLRVGARPGAGGLVRARVARSSRIGNLQKRAFWAGKGRVQEITLKFVGGIGKGDACLDVLAPIWGYSIRDSPRSRLDFAL